MPYWDYFWRYPRSVAKPVKDGIKTKSRGGSIGKTWWSKRWIGVLESFNMGARLGRGRSYARRGQAFKRWGRKTRKQWLFLFPMFHRAEVRCANAG
ncbi:MAG: hypothetical protein DKINENOH_01600 [bacterium]|nr:hypothetical protein [bacterium]